jgi:hypothetical protein
MALVQNVGTFDSNWMLLVKAVIELTQIQGEVT